MTSNVVFELIQQESHSGAGLPADTFQHLNELFRFRVERGVHRLADRICDCFPQVGGEKSALPFVEVNGHRPGLAESRRDTLLQ